MDLRSQIRHRLAALQRRNLTAGYSREAAVLMLIFERDGEPHFLLTRRTENVQTHKGQISFPGGMRDNGEELQGTAVRETFEEIGIGEEDIQILGRFHDYLSVTEYRVCPFAGYLAGPFYPVPQASEVAEILEVPFSIFQDPARLRIQQRIRNGEVSDVYYYSYKNSEIWGLTARIIKDFLEILYPAPTELQDRLPG
jgi:8-oxo-dGTP pyrophosphatase MutT (NUDIX family)